LSPLFWKTGEKEKLPSETKKSFQSRAGLKQCLVQGMLGWNQQQDVTALGRSIWRYQLKQRTTGRRGGEEGTSLSYSSQLTESKRQKGFLLFKLSILQKMLWIECVWCSLLFGVPMQCSQIGEYHCSLEKEGKSQCFMQGTHSCRSIVSLASMPGPAHILNSPRLHYLHSSTPMDSTFCVGQLRMVIGSTYWEFCQGS
jgi:hypothetical protein